MARKLRIGDLVIDNDDPRRQWIYQVVGVPHEGSVMVKDLCWGPNTIWPLKPMVPCTAVAYPILLERLTRIKNPELLELVLALG